MAQGDFPVSKASSTTDTLVNLWYEEIIWAKDAIAFERTL